MISGPRVALLAHWSPTNAVTRSVATLVGELQACGYVVAVCSSSESPHALAWPSDTEVDLDRLVVIRRPNVGYDFGSWSVALDLLPAAARADHTILVNDSLAGPFAPLGPLLAAFEGSAVDAWGLTDTDQFGRHLQSYLLGFRGGVLADRPLARFWSRARCESDKDRVIHRYELGLSRLLRSEGYISHPHYPHETVVPEGGNPVIAGWRRLVELGFPFVKREILRRPEIAPDGRRAAQLIQARFGADVADWVDEVAA